MKLENFYIDPLRRQLTALVGGTRVPILDLSFAQARIGLGGGTLRIGPVAGSLTAVAAGALDARLRPAGRNGAARAQARRRDRPLPAVLRSAGVRARRPDPARMS